MFSISFPEISYSISGELPRAGLSVEQQRPLVADTWTAAGNVY